MKRILWAALLPIALVACGDDFDSYAEKGVEEINEVIGKGNAPFPHKLMYGAGQFTVFEGEPLPWAELVGKKGEKPKTFMFSMEPQTGSNVVSFLAPTGIACRMIETLAPQKMAVKMDQGQLVQDLRPMDPRLMQLCATEATHYWSLQLGGRGPGS